MDALMTVSGGEGGPAFFGYMHPDHRIQRRVGTLFFVVGVITYFALQVGFNLRVNQSRNIAAEADDAYGYIIKAAQMRNDFFQDAPAYADLRRQISLPASNIQVAREQARQYHRLLEVYHPLHSLLMVALNGAGLSWETAYEALTIAGKVSIALAVAFWLYAVWGAGPAGIALLLLSPQVFPRQGMEYIVPSNLALAIAMGAWGATVLWRESRWTHRVMLFAVIAMIAMHPLGRVYALMTVVLYLWLLKRPWSRKAVLTSAAVLALVAVSFALPRFLTLPALQMVHFPYPEGWNYWQGLRGNARFAETYWSQWSATYKSGYSGILLLMGLGFLSLPSARRRPAAATGILLIALMMMSIAHALPGYPGVTVARNWSAAAVFLTGALGNLAFVWLFGLLSAVRRLVSSSKGISAAPKTVFYPALLALGFGAIGAFFWHAALAHEIASFDQYKNKSKSMISRHNNMSLDPAQPAELLRRARPGESVLYMHELPMYFYLIHGADRLGAVYWPLVVGTADEKVLVLGNDAIRYVVSSNPLVQIKNPLVSQGQGAISLGPSDKVQILCQEAKPAQQLQLHLENTGPEAALKVSFSNDVGEGGQVSAQIPADFSGWISVGGTSPLIADNFFIEPTQAEAPLRLKGLRFTEASALNWPWDEGVSLHFAGEKGTPEEAAQFNSADLCSRLNRPLRVVDDRGSTVLAEVTPLAGSGALQD